MDHVTAELAFDARCELGEGPVWDWRHDRLLWVDLLAGRLHLQPLGEDLAAPRPWNDTVGSVGLLGGEDLVVDTGADVVAFDPRTDVHRLLAGSPVRVSASTTRPAIPGGGGGSAS